MIFMHGTTAAAACDIIKRGFQDVCIIWDCSVPQNTYLIRADGDYYTYDEAAKFACEAGQTAAAKLGVNDTDIAIFIFDFPDDVADEHLEADMSADNMHDCWCIDNDTLNMLMRTDKIKCQVKLIKDAYEPYMRPFYLVGLCKDVMVIDDKRLRFTIDCISESNDELCWFYQAFLVTPDLDHAVDILAERREMERRFTEWLKETISSLTSKTMSISIEPTSYDDKLSQSFVLEQLQAYEASGDKTISFKDFFTNAVYELFYENDTIAYYEDNLMQEIIKHFNKADDNVKEAYKYLYDMPLNYQNTDEILELGGYDGVDININAFLDETYYLNVMFATPYERNTDMTAITRAFYPTTADITYGFVHNESLFEKTVDNALTYLIHQQGYTVSEIYTALHADKSDADSTDTSQNCFINSVVNELESYGGYDMQELTFMISATGIKLIELLDSMINKQGFLSFPATTHVGLFNEWVGCSSLLDVKLIKPAVMPCSMIRNIQIESMSRHVQMHNTGYTVNQVCDMASFVWTDSQTKDDVSVTDTAPDLCEENIHDTRRLLLSFLTPRSQTSSSDSSESTS